MMKNVIVIIIAMMTLLSCATVPSKNLNKENFSLGENEGAIAGVVGILKRTYSTGSRIFYTNGDIEKLIDQDQNNKQKHSFFIGTGAKAPHTIADFQRSNDDKYVYFFFVLKEKPGNYRFNEYTFFFNSGYTQELVTYPVKDPLNFTIEKGKIKYFGTLFLDSKNRNLIYTDTHKQTDLQEFAEKLPQLPITQ